MNQIFYRELQKTFVWARANYINGQVDANKATAIAEKLEFTKKQLEKNGKKRDRRILLYCVNTMLELIEEGNTEKVADFADTVHNMPEIFMGKRNLYSFRSEINAFKAKYGAAYFKKMYGIYPFFSRRAPENAAEYFISESDKDFKAVFPKRYIILCILGVVAFVLPFVVFTLLVPGEVPGGWQILALVGCFPIGVGLFNLVAAFLHQYLGHKLTFISFATGGALVAFSLFMIYNPNLYNAELSTYSLMSLFLLVLPAIIYPFFRMSVGEWIRTERRVSNTRYKKLLEGKRNFWLYEALHAELDIGAIYHLNRVFIILFLAIVVLTPTFGFALEESTLVLCPLNIALYALTVIMFIFSNIRDKINEHGKPFVFLAKNSNNRWDSSILDGAILLLFLGCAYVNLMLAAEVWGISLPSLNAL